MFIVDAFAHAPFTGNTAGVCIVPNEPELGWMQNVAEEMKQAETAFVWPSGTEYGLRWFTPAVEVDLCGHATLATAHVLWSSGYLEPRSEAMFNTRSGLLVCSLDSEEVRMDFPSEPPVESPAPLGMSELLPKGWVWLGRNRMDWFVQLASEQEVRGFEPDFSVIAGLGMRGLLLTAPSASHGVDFVSRFFAPQCGVPEDSVTGSAHCALAPYWSERLGRASLRGYQASRRGGYVRVEAKGDRVLMTGRARTALVGQLTD